MVREPIPYCGAAPVPDTWLLQWNLDPALLALLAGVALLLWRAGARSGPWVGFALLFVLFVSPLCALSSALFSMRVTHHVLLTAVAAPLLALLAKRPSGRGLAAWTAAHAAVFWGWHAPPAYAWALSNTGAYWLMQLTLLGSAIGLWQAIRGAPAPTGVACLLATMVQMGLLGALLTFAGTPLYAWHLATTAPWGLAPLEDQQLAGLIMWVPAAGIYLGAAMILANAWLASRQHAASAT